MGTTCIITILSALKKTAPEKLAILQFPTYQIADYNYINKYLSASYYLCLTVSISMDLIIISTVRQFPARCPDKKKRRDTFFQQAENFFVFTNLLYSSVLFTNKLLIIPDLLSGYLSLLVLLQ